MEERFDDTRRLLGTMTGSSWIGKLLEWAGHWDAVDDLPTLMVLDSALLCAERQPDPRDYWFMQLGALKSEWEINDPDDWGLVPASVAVAEHITELLATLPTEQLRLTAALLGVERWDVTRAVVGQVKKAFATGQMDVPSWALKPLEGFQPYDYAEQEVAVIRREEPQHWSPLHRAALTATVVWQLGHVIALAGQLAGSEALPPVLWQATAAGHACASIRVREPGTAVTLLAKINPRPNDAKLLWGQALPKWQWVVGWESYEDGAFINYAGGSQDSEMHARWHAEVRVEGLLRSARAIRDPATETPLIPPLGPREIITEMIRKVAAPLHHVSVMFGTGSPAEEEAAQAALAICERDREALETADDDQLAHLEAVYTQRLRELSRK